MGIVVDTNQDRDTVLAKIDNHVKAIGGWTKPLIGQPTDGVKYVGEKDVDILLFLYLLILFILPAILYWAYAKNNSVTAVVSDGKCTIRYVGQKGFEMADELANILRS